MRVLHVEDERWFHQRIRTALADHEWVWCQEVREALRVLGRESFDLILLDRNLKGIDSFESIPEIRKAASRATLLVLSADADGAAISEALDRGADDYILKTPEIAQELPTRIRIAVEASRAAKGLAANFPVKESILVGASSHVRMLRERAARAAAVDACVLITGETGTGKEVVAREIHRLRGDPRRPFVAVNCGAIPESLFESELFGHVKGAFTGAVTHQTGLVAAAHGGDLFLDEIGELPLSQQVKLLRFLQEGTFKPVGSHREERAQVRVLAATHRDLEAAVAAGRFREDLFYRLDVIRLHTLPLRERREDISALTQHFLTQFGSAPTHMTREALALLEKHPWRGNIRELSAVLQRALVESAGEASIRAAHIQVQNLTGVRQWGKLPQARSSVTAGAFQQFIDGAMRSYLEAALGLFEGDTQNLARALGISRATVYNQMKRLGIQGRRNGPRSRET